MGPESKSCGTLYLDGVPIMTGEIQEITILADEPEPETKDVLRPAEFLEFMEFTAHIKTPKHWNCRSRKRFIKLMMSEGISRNNAEWLADFMRGWMPYEQAWRKYSLCRFWVVRV